jgi:hypothetical protein
MDARNELDAAFTTPELLSGLDPKAVAEKFRWDESWREETLSRGAHAGQGWVLREYSSGAPTGRVIRWHPGGGHHGDKPYWRVSGPSAGKSGIVR